MGIVAQPTVPSDLEEVRSLPWIRDQYTPQKVARVRCNIFWEGQWSRDNVFIQKIDIVALRIGRIIVKGKVTGKHGILHKSNQYAQAFNLSSEHTNMTPQLQTSTFRPV